MSLTYGFYDSLNGDRRYNALQMSRMFDGIINDGIFRFIGSAFEPLAIGGMNISIGTGRAWFNNTWTYNDALFPLEVEASDIILNRIDTVIIDVDSRSAHRKNNIIIVKGTPATTPVPAVLLDEDDHHQYALCYILVNKNATEIIQANITNLVGNPEHCPFVKLVAGDGITKSDEPPLGPIDLELWLDTTEDNYQASIFADMSGRIGDTSALTTEDKTSLVGAVNETVDNLNLVQSEKADKLQEDWINATLQNGWTKELGGVQYAKNDLGFVTIDFYATSGTVTNKTIIFQLPVGYRPTNPLALGVFDNSSGNHSGQIISVLDTGAVRVSGSVAFVTGRAYRGTITFYAG